MLSLLQAGCIHRLGIPHHAHHIIDRHLAAFSALLYASALIVLAHPGIAGAVLTVTESGKLLISVIALKAVLAEIYRTHVLCIQICCKRIVHAENLLGGTGSLGYKVHPDHLLPLKSGVSGDETGLTGLKRSDVQRIPQRLVLP